MIHFFVKHLLKILSKRVSCIQMLIFSLSIDVAMQKLFTAVTELSKMMKDLREELRQFRHSCRCGQSDSVGLASLEPLELPLPTIEALDHAEETLQNGPKCQTMVVV